MKKLLTVAIGLVVLFGVAVTVAFLLTADIKNTADTFFDAVKAKDSATAYQHLSEDFRASTTQAEFAAFLEKTALLRFKEASWSNRSISGGRGELDGSIVTDGGGVVPIKLGFVKENGRWLIYSIYKPKSGLVRDETGKLPSEVEQVALVKESMRVFARSVTAKDFSEFHNHISVLWQRQATTDSMNQAFKSFMDNELNLSPLENYSPVFEGTPSIGDDGALVIKGHYPTKPLKVLFKLTYVYEGVGWKLMGTKVNVTPAS